MIEMGSCVYLKNQVVRMQFKKNKILIYTLVYHQRLLQIPCHENNIMSNDMITGSVIELAKKKIVKKKLSGSGSS